MNNDLRSMSFAQLSSALMPLGVKRYNIEQIYRWLHVNMISSFDEMTNVSKALRAEIASSFDLYNLTVEKKLQSKIDDTVKFLFKLYDGHYIETVVMKYKYGYSICVSSQVGCRMGCKFCASAIAGFVRNLTAGEILSQVYLAQKELNIKISHVVLMGVGEPLDNFENVLGFVGIISSPLGQNISMRNISLSTCGVVSGIKRLMQLKLPLTLSISLHAPNDEIRSRTMPINQKWNVSSLISTCREYTKQTKRRISFEYALIKGVNDSEGCAMELSRLLKGMLCHVNLIPVNSVKETGFSKPDRKSIEHFQQILQKNGITTTIRRTLGSDISASCGQLRRKAENKVN